MTREWVVKIRLTRMMTLKGILASGDGMVMIHESVAWNFQDSKPNIDDKMNEGGRSIPRLASVG